MDEKSNRNRSRYVIALLSIHKLCTQILMYLGSRLVDERQVNNYECRIKARLASSFVNSCRSHQKFMQPWICYLQLVSVAIRTTVVVKVNSHERKKWTMVVGKLTYLLYVCCIVDFLWFTARTVIHLGLNFSSCYFIFSGTCLYIQFFVFYCLSSDWSEYKYKPAK